MSERHQSRFLMGFDLGGSGGRCLLIELESAKITTAFRTWTHRQAPNTSGWGFDLDLDQVWRVLGETSREVLDRADANPDQVLGVAATSMRHGMVLLDAGGRELLAVPNRDARAVGEAMELARERGEELFQRTGQLAEPHLCRCPFAVVGSTRPRASEERQRPAQLE